MTRLPENARSECVAPSVRPFGGVVESIRMFHAACAASQRPGRSPTRGSGDGVVADTIGSTGFGITAGGGGGGGGGVPRPPRPAAFIASPPAGAAADAPPGGVAAGGVVVTGGGVAAGGGVAGAGGVAAGGGFGCGAAAGAAAGVTAGGAVFEEPAHAATPTVPAASREVTHKATIHFMVDLPPASCSSDRSQSTGRRRRRTRTGTPSRPAPRRTP